jgi:hypothetical protein
MIKVFRGSSCVRCQHFLGFKQDEGVEETERAHCAAFDAIPAEIWAGIDSHEAPHLGDRGIQFLPKEPSASQAIAAGRVA